MPIFTIDIVRFTTDKFYFIISKFYYSEYKQI